MDKKNRNNELLIKTKGLQYFVGRSGENEECHKRFGVSYVWHNMHMCILHEIKDNNQIHSNWFSPTKQEIQKLEESKVQLMSQVEPLQKQNAILSECIRALNGKMQQDNEYLTSVLKQKKEIEDQLLEQ
ncbi:hypothetical protein RFI_27382, partial [Reticulomyxa filosa]